MTGSREGSAPLPPEVYWRRRIVAIAGLVLVIAVLYFLIVSPGGDGTAADDDPTVTTEPTVTPEPTSDAQAGTDVSRACTSADLTLAATPTPFEFGAGSLPVFDVAITHIGTTPCLLNTESEGTALVITSGSDRVFASTDCPADATINAREFLLQPDANETFQVTWSRQRSAEGCQSVSSSPGDGFYWADLSIQGIEAEPAQFQLSS